MFGDRFSFDVIDNSGKVTKECNVVPRDYILILEDDFAVNEKDFNRKIAKQIMDQMFKKTLQDLDDTDGTRPDLIYLGGKLPEWGHKSKQDRYASDVVHSNVKVDVDDAGVKTWPRLPTIMVLPW